MLTGLPQALIMQDASSSHLPGGPQRLFGPSSGSKTVASVHACMHACMHACCWGGPSVMRCAAAAAQVHTLLKGLEKIAASADIPMLVAGDFNSTPGSAAHGLLIRRAVDPGHPVRPPLRSACSGSLPCLHLLLVRRAAPIVPLAPWSPTCCLSVQPSACACNASLVFPILIS